MSGRVRPGAEADASEIAEVHVRAWRWAYRDLLPASFLAALSVEARERMWRGWLAPGTATRVFTWDEDGRIRGFSAAGPARDEPDAGGAAMPYAIYLDEAVVGRGAGRALHDAALDALRATGFGGAVLWVLEDNALARTFYARQGWAPDGHRKSCSFGDEQRIEVRLTRRL
jgi:GNAT superfamily N-acetyltransferase